MHLCKSILLAVVGTATLAACSTTPAREARSPEAARELASALEGRTPGPPVDCIPNLRGAAQMQVIDQWTILFREGDTVYVQNPRGGCQGVGRPSTTLVTRQFGGQRLCTGDINQMLDLNTGSTGGTCIFAPFVPYRKTS